MITAKKLFLENALARRKVNDRIGAEDKHGRSNETKYPGRHLLRSPRNGNAPGKTESPKAIGEVIRTRGNAENVDERDDRNARRRRGHLFTQPRVKILGRHFPDEFLPPKSIHVEADEEKGQNAGDPLERICPIARRAVFDDVVPRLERQLHAVKRVEQKRKDNYPPLEDGQVRRVVDLPHSRVELLLPLERLGVCPQVKHHETTHGNDARERVELAQQKRAAVLGQERLIFRCGGHETSSACGQWAMYGTLAGTSR